jgi:hypothetical protein
MKRKSFLKRTLGLTAAGVLLGSNRLVQAQDTPVTSAEKKLKSKNKFLLGWITAWLENIKREMPESEKIKTIESNGKACAERSGMFAKALSFKGNLDGFLAEFRTEIGEKNVIREGRKVRLVYEQCFCPLVSDISEKLPADYCLCTQGWTKTVFGTVTGKPVKVDLKSTIKRGDPTCTIEIDT